MMMGPRGNWRSISKGKRRGKRAAESLDLGGKSVNAHSGGLHKQRWTPNTQPEGKLVGLDPHRVDTLWPNFIFDPSRVAIELDPAEAQPHPSLPMLSLQH